MPAFEFFQIGRDRARRVKGSSGGYVHKRTARASRRLARRKAGAEGECGLPVRCPGDIRQPCLGFRLTPELAFAIDGLDRLVDRVHGHAKRGGGKVHALPKSAGKQGLTPTVTISDGDESDKRRGRQVGVAGGGEPLLVALLRGQHRQHLRDRKQERRETRGVERKAAALTRKLVRSVAKPGVAVLDHLLVGDDFLGRRDRCGIELLPHCSCVEEKDPQLRFRNGSLERIDRGRRNRPLADISIPIGATIRDRLVEGGRRSPPATLSSFTTAARTGSTRLLMPRSEPGSASSVAVKPLA